MSHRKLGRFKVPANRRPSFAEGGTGDLIEIPPPPVVAGTLNEHNDHLRCYTLGACTVMVTREFGKYHLSIAHPHRYPSWIEISAAWYGAVPGAAGRNGALILPRLEAYMNIHEHCMHVHEVDDSAWSNGEA